MTTMKNFEVGRSYACLMPLCPISQPLRAQVLTEPDDGEVYVELNHPDGELTRETVPLRCLDTAWETKPSQHAWGRFEPVGTWEEIAEQSYQRVLQQRRLARRLHTLGIERAEEHYAGRGGTLSSWSGYDTRITLNAAELEHLLDLAELGSTHQETYSKGDTE